MGTQKLILALAAGAALFTLTGTAQTAQDNVTLEERVAELEKAILDEGPENVAVFIAEPIIASGGVIVPPPGKRFCSKSIKLPSSPRRSKGLLESGSSHSMRWRNHASSLPRASRTRPFSSNALR